ncbi:MAG: trigger factor [Bacilli bacterium]|nr:trigger factor [Bacilli bacterium]
MSTKNKHEVVVKIEKEEWNQALDQSFNKRIKDLKMDGFRKGKVPKEVYLKRYGIESLYMDAVDLVLPNAYTKALDESKLIPVVQPKMDIKNIDEEGVEILFNIITKPEVKLGKYKGLKVKTETVKVTKEEVTEEIENLRQRFTENVIKEGKLETGDVAVIDFEGFKDGLPFEGGKAEGYSLEIGSHTFIPGFEEQLIGMNPKEEKEIELTFPENYPSEELKDQKVTFKVKLNEVKQKKVPEINEEFFKDLDMEGINDLKSLEKMMEEKIQVTKEAEAENIFIDNLLDAVAKNVKIEVPEEMVVEEIDRMLNRYKEQLQMQGIDINQYYQITNTNEEQLREQMNEEAEKHVIYRLMLEEIAKEEKIEITDKEAKEEAKRLAEQYSIKTDEFIQMFGGLDMIKYDLEMRKTIEVLKENN